MIGTILQRISGTGVALVASPFLSAIFGPVQGILISNLINGVGSLMLCVPMLKDVDWGKFLGLAGFALLGEMVGAQVVHLVPAPWMQLVVGGTVVLAMVTTWLSGKRLPHVRLIPALPITGFLGGILMATAGLGAPATVIFARLIRWDQKHFAATMQPLFSAMAFGAFLTKRLMGVPFDTAWVDPFHLGGFAIALIAAVIIGSRLSIHVPSKQARDLAFLLAGTGAVIATIRGIVGLIG